MRDDCGRIEQFALGTVEKESFHVNVAQALLTEMGDLLYERQSGDKEKTHTKKDVRMMRRKMVLKAVRGQNCYIESYINWYYAVD